MKKKKAALVPILFADIRRSGLKTYQLAEQLRVDEQSLLLGFDYQSQKKEGVSKGSVMIPQGARYFYRQVFSQLPRKARCFYQTIRHWVSCALFIDVDAEDPDYDIKFLLQVLFEQLSERVGFISAEHLWTQTFLLDSSENEWGERTCCSGHAVVYPLVFENTTPTMKHFMCSVKQELECKYPREDFPQLWTLDKKNKEWKIPLDVSVYSRARNFRLYGSAKMTADKAKTALPARITVEPLPQDAYSREQGRRGGAILAQHRPARGRTYGFSRRRA